MQWLTLVTMVLGMALPLRAESPPHWAYQKVIRPTLPNVQQSDWPHNAIDRFTLAKMEEHRLAPSPPAVKHELLRRVTFDLTGLPPTWEDTLAFERDSSPEAFEREVDRLLCSPRYAERMATHWLDLARYADTHGFHLDSHRDMWRYRDEVIASFARHQPFDQFTIEQLAGDMLANATMEQKIASGFNRNHMINFEGGAIPAEYLDKYVSDRVTTTATVWLGQTLECARCHDHKHDPYTTKDFFALYAFFNNVAEEGLDGRRGNAAPYIIAPTREQAFKLNDYDQRLAAVASKMQERAAAIAPEQIAWEAKVREDASLRGNAPSDEVLRLRFDETRELDKLAAKVHGEAQWLPGKFQGGVLLDGESYIEIPQSGNFTAGDAFTFSAWVFPTTRDAMTILSHADEALGARGYTWSLDDGRLQFSLTNHAENAALVMEADKPLALRRWQHIVITYDGSRTGEGVKLYLDGQTLKVVTKQNNLGTASIAIVGALRMGGGLTKQGFRGLLDETRIYSRELTATEVALLAGSDPVRAIVSISPDRRTPEQVSALRDYYLQHHDTAYQRWRREQLALQQARRGLLEVCPTTMVMAELAQPRRTFILDRGDYQQPTDEVTANTPRCLPPLPSDAPRNRLTLASWLVNGQHPITARVAVNRLWQLHFGQGIVRTPDDFGAAGDRPTHPELLDWLADELVRSNWNLQHIQRLIVTSATYQQSTRGKRELRQLDPDNIYLARAPRLRLTAEMLRDQALLVSDLLVGEIGGPSVFPYQPSGLWEEVGRDDGEYSAQSYTPGSGAALYRRGLYTFLKRTSPPPGMSLFDAPDRETCAVGRPLTNTPLQALVLWNDPTFVEAARALAERYCREDRVKLEANIDALFRRVLGRNPTVRESKTLALLFERQLAVYRAKESEALGLLDVGESPRDPRLPAAELASWTIMVQTILCSDEALHRN